MVPTPPDSDQDVRPGVEVLFRGHIVTLEIQDGKWEIARHASAVAVLVSDGPKILGVRQYRRAVATHTWEIPAGLIDPGESPEAAAARELAEEAQLSGTLELITSAYASPGFTDEKIHLYQATDCRPAFADGDDDEELELEWRDALEVWRAVAAGEEQTSYITLLAVRHLLARLGLEVGPA